jgi:hypothetical protein
VLLRLYAFLLPPVIALAALAASRRMEK